MLPGHFSRQTWVSQLPPSIVLFHLLRDCIFFWHRPKLNHPRHSSVKSSSDNPLSYSSNRHLTQHLTIHYIQHVQTTLIYPYLKITKICKSSHQTY